MEKHSPKSGDRGPVTVYLSKELYKRFRKACEKDSISASLALEGLMQDYLDSQKVKKD